MAGEYVENPADVFDYPDDWQESTASGHSGELSWDDSTATVQGWIPWNKLRSAARYFLGYSYADAASPYALHRENPSPHPTQPWLRCVGLSWRGIVPIGNTANPNHSPYVYSPFWTFPDQLRTTQYEKAELTLRYKAPKGFHYLEDSAIDSYEFEWARSFWVEGEEQLDVLTADGVGQLILAENNAGPPVTGPPKIGVGGTTFPAPVPVLLDKGQYVLHWYGVPWDYLSADEDVFYPTKLIKCLGNVNSVDFLVGDTTGFFPAGTLLMKAAKYEIFNWPVAAADKTSPLRGVNLHVPCEYFDPPKGVSGSSYRGHNLMPWRGAAGDATGGKFFYATRGGGAGDPPLLGSKDFNAILSHVNDAAHQP